MIFNPFCGIIPSKGNNLESTDMTINAKSEREKITTIEAEQRTGLSRNYFALLLRRGKLEGERPARDWFIYVDSLENFLATNRKPGPKGPRRKPTTDIS
jgi:hypothetical protein